MKKNHQKHQKLSLAVLTSSLFIISSSQTQAAPLPVAGTVVGTTTTMVDGVDFVNSAGIL